MAKSSSRTNGNKLRKEISYFDNLKRNLDREESSLNVKIISMDGVDREEKNKLSI